jgi:Uma2 family endonuclease
VVGPSAGHVGPWSIDDVEALPDNGDHSRYELLNPGVLTVSPASGTVHQRVCRKLANLLDTAAIVAGAEVEILEGVGIEMPSGRLAAPDIAVVDGSYADTNPARYPAAMVHAVVEIVSLATHQHDRMIKPPLYAEAGIPVYWRMELVDNPFLSVARLQGSQYVELIIAPSGQPTAIPFPFPVKLDPAALIRRARR